MSYNTRMLLGLVIGIIIILLWDLWLWLKWKYEATISGVIQDTRKRHWWLRWVALVVFIFLYWHWFM